MVGLNARLLSGQLGAAAAAAGAQLEWPADGDAVSRLVVQLRTLDDTLDAR